MADPAAPVAPAKPEEKPTSKSAEKPAAVLDGRDPGLVQEFDKIEELESWRVLVGFGLKTLLDDNPSLALEVLIRRAYREPPDAKFAGMSKGQRFAAILDMFELKVSLTKKRGSTT